jgi:hypothetical protein
MVAAANCSSVEQWTPYRVRQSSCKPLTFGGDDMRKYCQQAVCKVVAVLGAAVLLAGAAIGVWTTASTATERSISVAAPGEEYNHNQVLL